MCVYISLYIYIYTYRERERVLVCNNDVNEPHIIHMTKIITIIITIE